MIMSKVASNAKKLCTTNPFQNLKHATSLDLSNLEQFLSGATYFSGASSRSIVEPALRTIFGAEASQINALFALNCVKSGGGSIERLALTDEGCAQEKRVRGGCQQISEKLLHKSKILEGKTLLLNTVLVEVRQNESDQQSGVEILTKNLHTNEMRAFKAKKLISSLPLNQYQYVNFVPDLPWLKKNVFQFCQMGNLIKFVVTYESAFWRENGFSGG